MLDELRDLFLAALKFEGNDAMPLVNRWNEAVKRVQAVFDNMTSKNVDAVPVCRCEDCKFGTNDPTGIVICRMASYPNYATRNQNWYCADGERKGGDE